MSVNLFIQAFNTNLAPFVKLTLMEICDYYNEGQQEAWPSIARIAHRMNVSERSVYRAIKELQDKKLIIKKKRGTGDGSHNVYTVNHMALRTYQADEFQSDTTAGHLTNPVKAPDRLSGPPCQIVRSPLTDCQVPPDRLAANPLKEPLKEPSRARKTPAPKKLSDKHKNSLVNHWLHEYERTGEHPTVSSENPEILALRQDFVNRFCRQAERKR